MFRRVLNTGPSVGASAAQGQGASKSGSASRSAPPTSRSRTRGRAYLDALRSLDPGSAQVVVDMAAVYEVIEAEFPDGLLPSGLVSLCYLGQPYEVHILDLVGQIVEHYEWNRPMPPKFEAARRLALHPAYVAIEVHADRLVAIREDGSAIDVGGSQ